MVKTHLKTGLKYLCKTKKYPYTYSGSGIDWCKHLKEHGPEHNTEILKICKDQTELYFWGKYYSKLYRVVTAMDDYGNKIWANRIPETGGGDGVYGDSNPMRNPLVVKKRSGDNHHFKNPEVLKVMIGENHFRYDHTKYQWQHIKSKKIVELTQRELIVKYQLQQGNVNKLISGKRKSHKGWKLFTGS